MKLSNAMVFVSDMAESARFYRDTIGLPLKFESPEWTEFATEGATFALHNTHETAKLQTNEKAPGLCQPGFSVEDLGAFHQRMLDAGVECIQPPRHVFGTQIAKYADPDGLVILISEITEGI